MDNPLRRPEEILAFRTLREIFAPRPRQVWSVGPTDSVLTALQIMTDKNIGFLPVFESDRLVGVLSERDCARNAALNRKPLESTPVAEIMVRDVVTVDLAQTFADCLIPLPYQSDLTIYGKDVMDFTVLGLRSM
jgi:CBS domain-containing protein